MPPAVTPDLAPAGNPRSRTTLGHQPVTVAWLMLVPAIVLMVTFLIIPIILTFGLAFTNARLISPEPARFIGLDNFTRLFSSPTFWRSLQNTVVFALVIVPVQSAIALGLALLINAKVRGVNFFRTVYFLPVVTSMVVVSMLWMFMYQPHGLINVLLAKIGIDAIPWLSNSELAKFCVIFVAVWAQIGWHATLYLAYLQAIPADIYEQAAVDGANRRQQFFNITLPQMVPAMGVSIFMLLTGGLKVYDLPYGLTSGGPGYSTYTVTQSIILTGIGSSRYGLGSALGVIFFICCALLVALQQVITNLVEKRLS